MPAEFIFEKLDKHRLDRERFDCGVEVLNVFLKQRANQEQAKNLNVTYVATTATALSKQIIFGYYTLSNGAFKIEGLPSELTKGIPKTYTVPTVRLGRLARDIQYPGMGTELLKDALLRIVNLAEISGIRGVEVDAKDEKAKIFYRKFGFVDLSEPENCLFLPITTILDAL